MPLEILPAFREVSADASPVKLPTKLLATLLNMLTPLNVLVAVSVAPPRFNKAPDGVPAPVPPWSIDSGVLNPEIELMSEFAPLAAAPRITRAPEAVSAPVPPRTSGRMPVETFAAFKDGRLQRLLVQHGVHFDDSVRIDPYSLLPGWVHPR